MSDTYPIKEYDSNGKLVYYKRYDGKEWWYKYDSSGNRIHYKNSYGYESWYEYDSHGNVIHAKHSNGIEYWYDEEGNDTKDPVKVLLISQKLYSEKRGEAASTHISLLPLKNT